MLVLAVSFFGSGAAAALPHLSVSFSGSASGNVVTFTTTVLNDGTVNLTSVTVEDQIAFNGSLVQTRTANCGSGSLAINATCQSSIQYTAPGAGNVTDAVTVDSGQTQPVQAGNGGSTTGSGSVTAVLLNPPATVLAGDHLTFQITGTNTGTTGLTNVVVSTTNAGFAPASQSCPTLAPNNACTLTATYTVTNTDASNGQITVNAAMASVEINPPITTTLTVPVGKVQPPALTIVSGNDQILPVNMPDSLVVLLTNNGLPVANATINWTATNATLSSPTSTTDMNGKATNTVVLHQLGAASVKASSSSPAAGPVTFSVNSGLASLSGLTPPEVQVANALDHACPALAALPTLTSAEQDLLAQCQALDSAAAQNPGQVANALNQMLPHDALLQTSASVLVAAAQFDNIKARLAAIRSGSGGDHFGGLAFSTPDGVLPVGKIGESALGFDDKPADKSQEVGSGFDRWGYFMTGNFGNGFADPRAETPGYGFHSDGVTAGVDYRFNDHMIFGVSAGYANYSSDVDEVGGGLDTRGWSLSAYSTFFRQDNWYVDGVLTWGHNDYDINRRILYALTTSTGIVSVNQTATSNSSGTTLAGSVTLGRDFNKGAWSFGPYLRGNWTRTDFDGYDETLASGLPGSGLGLAVQGRSSRGRFQHPGSQAELRLQPELGRDHAARRNRMGTRLRGQPRQPDRPLPAGSDRNPVHLGWRCHRPGFLPTRTGRFVPVRAWSLGLCLLRKNPGTDRRYPEQHRARLPDGVLMNAMRSDNQPAAAAPVPLPCRPGLRELVASKHHASRMTETIRPNPTSGCAP